MTYNFRKYAGWLTILALILLPVIIWLFMLPLSQRFFDFISSLNSLGKIFGLVGMAMMAINLILSSRLKIFDKYFYGINVLYNYHRVIGAVAFSFLLFHPVLLMVKYLTISLRSAALFLLPSGDLAIAYGIVALILMMVLIIATFYLKIKYQYWKFSHKFMVLAFVFACLHVLFINSDISRSPFLRSYILGLAALGLASGIYRAWLSRFFNANLAYAVEKVTALNNEITEVEMKPLGDKSLKFQAGQFIFISFRSGRISSEIHPFSLSSAPAEKNLKITVKNLGDYTALIKNLAVGDKAWIEGPFGKFSYKNIANKNQIWIAGGVGITPFLSMAEDLNGGKYKIDLYYAVKDENEAVGLGDLKNIGLKNNNFRVIPWFSNISGRINAQKISDLSYGLIDKDIMLCGPLIFMQNLREQFKKMAVPVKSVHNEEFNLIES
jgi:predicted ferric reductase